MSIRVSPSKSLVPLAIICSFLGSGVSFGTILGFTILPIRIVGIICAIWLLLNTAVDKVLLHKIQFLTVTYIYMVLVTLLFTENYINSISLLLDYLCMFSVFCIVAFSIIDDAMYRKYTNLYLICTIVTIGICFYEFMTQNHIASNYTQVYSASDWAYIHTVKAPTAFLYNPNNVAVLMIIAIPLMLEKESIQGSAVKKAVWGVAVVLDVGVILMTGSRGGLLAGMIILVIFFLFSNIKLCVKIIVLILGVATIAYFSDFVFNQLGYGGMLKNGRLSIFAEGDGGRSRIAKTSLENVFIINPIFGSGAGSLENHGLNSAHNTIIEVLCNYGIFGLIIFAFMLIRLFRIITDKKNIIIPILLLIAFLNSMFIPPTIMTIYVLFIPLALRISKSYIDKDSQNECVDNY